MKPTQSRLKPIHQSLAKEDIILITEDCHIGVMNFVDIANIIKTLKIDIHFLLFSLKRLFPGINIAANDLEHVDLELTVKQF